MGMEKKMDDKEINLIFLGFLRLRLLRAYSGQCQREAHLWVSCIAIYQLLVPHATLKWTLSSDTWQSKNK